MATKTKTFKPQDYVSLSDLSLLAPKITVSNSGNYVKLTGVPNIRVTSTIVYAKEDDYGKTDVAVRVSKEEYDTYLTFFDINIKPKLETFFTDPNATVLGKTNKKRKAALEIIQSGFFEDSKSDKGDMIMKLRVNTSTLSYLVKEDYAVEEQEIKEILWKSMCEGFAFMGITKSQDGKYYVRFNLARIYVKEDPALVPEVEEGEVENAFVSTFFRPIITEDLPATQPFPIEL